MIISNLHCVNTIPLLLLSLWDCMLIYWYPMFNTTVLINLKMAHPHPMDMIAHSCEVPSELRLEMNISQWVGSLHFPIEIYYSIFFNPK